MTIETQPAAATLESVKMLFDNWRSNRGKMGPFPEELWRAAVLLLQHHDVKTVCETLRITKPQLKDRYYRYLPEDSTSTDNVLEANNFVTVKLPSFDKVTQKIVSASKPAGEAPSPLTAAATKTTSLNIELKRPDGLSLLIQAISLEEVQSLIKTFMG